MSYLWEIQDSGFVLKLLTDFDYGHFAFKYISEKKKEKRRKRREHHLN